MTSEAVRMQIWTPCRRKRQKGGGLILRKCTLRRSDPQEISALCPERFYFAHQCFPLFQSRSVLGFWKNRLDQPAGTLIGKNPNFHLIHHIGEPQAA